MSSILDKLTFPLFENLFTKAVCLYPFYNSVHRGLNFQIQVKRCAECGCLFARRKDKRLIYPHLCNNCYHKFTPHKRLSRLEVLNADEMNMWSSYQTYFLGEFKGKFLEAFINAQDRLAAIFKENGKLKEIDFAGGKKICCSYLRKSIKKLKREINFTDLSLAKKRKFGLEEYITEDDL